MSIQSNITCIRKITELFFKEDGSATIIIASGEIIDGAFVEFSLEHPTRLKRLTVELTPLQTSNILAVAGDPNKTRYADISQAIYNELLTANILSGTIL